MVTARRSPNPGRAEALEKLREAGLSIPQWAKANGFSASTVKALLYGHSKGLRGESHKAAIALGLKTGVIVPAEGFTPVRRVKVPLAAVRS